MTSAAAYAAAALAEIGGCFAFWAGLRLGRTVLWTVLLLAALVLFAVLLKRHPKRKEEDQREDHETAPLDQPEARGLNCNLMSHTL